MFKKILVLVIILFCAIGGGFYFKWKSFPKESLKTNIANPASVFCEEQGGRLEIRKDKEGNERGFCLFDDGSECDEWAFYNKECQKGERFCKDLCGDGICQEIVCLAIGCPCAETKESCPEDCQKQKVLLYYYNPEKDKDENGNIKCSRDGLVAIEREILISPTPIKDTIEILLKGKENLTEKDLAQGITTEYPLGGFKLKSVNLKEDGTLILEFADPLNKSVGGACRVGILWFQIEATAKQFPAVKKVQFLPEELFQP